MASHAQAQAFDRREYLARWLTAPENPYFARAMVNRLWWQYFGRGLVNPVDDMSKPDAPATHPELLEALTAQFVANDFDVKYFIRAITSSQAYQRTSRSPKDKEDEAKWYARMSVRVMTPSSSGATPRSTASTPASVASANSIGRFESRI